MRRSYVSKVSEPGLPEHQPSRYWRIRVRRDGLSGSHCIDIRHPRRDGSWTVTTFPMSDRASPRKVLAHLRCHDARLPETPTKAHRFAEELLAAVPMEVVVSTRSPGWCDKGRGFVMPSRLYGTAQSKYAWDANSSGAFGTIAGSLEDFRSGVLAIGRQSRFVTLAVLIALASPLVGYVEARRGRRLVRETAMFHFAGPTSSGKTTLARVTQSVFGDPREFCDYRASERKIAEEAYSRNDLVAIFDEAEHEDGSDRQLLFKMKLICRCVTAGRSKGITSSLHETLPELRWSCFGVSTGPETQTLVSGRLARNRQGQAARFFDFTVPPPVKGGIIDALAKGDGLASLEELSSRRVACIERTIDSNHGVLLPAWIEHLLSENVSGLAARLAHRFAVELCADLNGLPGRIARKIGVLYAAGILGIEADLLPWPRSWVRKVLTEAYWTLLPKKDGRAMELESAMRALSASMSDRRRFLRVNCTDRGVPALKIGEDTVGCITLKGDQKHFFLFQAKLPLIGIRSAAVGTELLRSLAADGAKSRVFRVACERDRKIRGWSFDPRNLSGGT